MIFGPNESVVLQGTGEQGSFWGALSQGDTLLPCSQHADSRDDLCRRFSRHVNKFQNFLFREIHGLFSDSLETIDERHMALESSDTASTMWKISYLSAWTKYRNRPRTFRQVFRLYEWLLHL